MTEPTLVVWVLYDATADKKYIKMDPVEGSLAIFESEEAAIAAKKLHCGTDYKRCEYYSTPQPAPEKFCEDTALSLAERTFSTEVDEQLAEDIIQYARRLHSRNTAQQPTPTEPVIRKLGIMGAAFDPPTIRRAYTYSDQPNNTTAWKLGKVACKFRPRGDVIDYGLQLLQHLQYAGFGVFEIDESDPTSQPTTKCTGAGCTDQGCPAHYATPDVAKLVEALEGLLEIVSESYGVAGYHTNGDIAEWDEFVEVEMAEEALELYRKQGEGL